jgi:hypothetical protein
MDFMILKKSLKNFGFPEVNTSNQTPFGYLGILWTRFVYHCQQMLSRYSQITQGKQCLQLRCVLGKFPVLHLWIRELSLDHFERLLHRHAQIRSRVLDPGLRIDQTTFICENLRGCIVIKILYLTAFMLIAFVHVLLVQIAQYQSCDLSDIGRAGRPVLSIAYTRPV